MKKQTVYRLLIISIAFVYVAFGIPKVLGDTSVESLVLATFPFFNGTLMALLGVAEVFLALGLVYKKTRIYAAFGIIMHLIGTFIGYLVNFQYFFNSTTVFTLEGEFVFKNIVFIAVALFILQEEFSYRSANK